MSNLTDALIAAKLVGGSGGSGGGSGLPEVTADDNGDVLTVVDGAWGKAAPSLPPFKFYTLVVTYDSTTESGEGRVYRCKDGQYERTHIIVELSVQTDTETEDTRIALGDLRIEEGASEEDMSDAASGWLQIRVRAALELFDPEDLTLCPLMLFIS